MQNQNENEEIEEVEYDMNNFNNAEEMPGKGNEVNYEEIFGENLEEYLDDKEKDNK